MDQDGNFVRQRVCDDWIDLLNRDKPELLTPEQLFSIDSFFLMLLGELKELNPDPDRTSFQLVYAPNTERPKK